MTKLYIFLVIGAALQMAAQGAPSRGVCNTPQCIQVAEGILKDFNHQADPCVDFSEYTCGGFYQRETLPKNTKVYSYLKLMQLKNNELVQQLVKTDDPLAPKAAEGDDVASRNIQRMHDYYTACMDEAQLGKVGRQPLLNKIHQMVQLYSVPGSLIQQGDLPPTKKGALSNVIGQNIRNGWSSFFIFSIEPDIIEPSRNLVYLSPDGLGLGDPKSYEDADGIRAYERAIGEMFYLLYTTGQPVRNQITSALELPESWIQVAKEVVDFEKAYSKVIPASHPSNPETDHNPVTLAELAQRTPSLDWSLIFKNAFPSGVKTPEVVIVAQPDYLNKLGAFLKATEPRTLQLYFAWSMILNLGLNLDAVHRQPLEVLGGISTRPEDRHQICAKWTSDNLLDIISYYFVEATFPERAMRKVDEMIDTLRVTFTKSFQSYNWLDSFTRKGALEKVKGFVHKVGYSSSGPDDRSQPSIDRFYSGLQIDNQDHFENQARAGNFWSQTKFRNLDKKVDRMHMDVSAPTVDAFYNPAMNDISVPAGILQPPFFHVDNPEYLNYGAIGTVAGHELTHGFDNNGRQWDSTGRFRNWWSNSTVEAFNSRANCFIEQYGNFTVPGPEGKELPVDGQLTL
ncbi:hypothetical protein BGZ65_001057, partial [Modicella reniformis]